ncbi:hypothetical protein [Scytonema sp. NUACC21]
MNQSNTLQYEFFRIFALDTENGSYFVGRVQNFLSQPDSFFWCSASEPLTVGNVVKGYVGKSNRMKSLPVLFLPRQRLRV